MNTSSPLISVLFPVYNSEKFLKEAIDSILNQTYAHFEFIIIDDCSTDSSVEIIKSYQDERIIFIQKEKNTGYTDSLNMGIQMAKGKYLARMDSDDISMPTRFAKQIDILEQNEEIVLCGADVQIIDSQSKTRIPYTHEDILIQLLEKTAFTHPVTMIRKSTLWDNQLTYDRNLEPSEDYDLWVKLAFLGKTANHPDVLLHYREHQNQTSQKRYEEQMRKKNLIRSQIWSRFLPELKDKSAPIELIQAKDYKENRLQLWKNLVLLNKLSRENQKAKWFSSPKINQFIFKHQMNLLTLYAQGKVGNHWTDLFYFIPRIFSLIQWVGLSYSIKFILKLFLAIFRWN